MCYILFSETDLCSDRFIFIFIFFFLKSTYMVGISDLTV